MFLFEKEFDQMKTENKQLQMENKRLRESISDISQTIEELKREKDARVLTNGNQSVSSSGNWQETVVKCWLLCLFLNGTDLLDLEAANTKGLTRLTCKSRKRPLALTYPSSVQQTKIAFTAALTHDIRLGELQPVEYDKVISNIGNAFDARHGHFTAPVKGVYILSGSILNVKGVLKILKTDLEQLKKNFTGLSTTVAELKKENAQLKTTCKCGATTTNASNVDAKKPAPNISSTKPTPKNASTVSSKKTVVPAAATTEAPAQVSKVVGFTAALTKIISLGEHQPVEYDKVLTNEGKAFDKRHGHFIAPVKGLYILSATIINIEKKEMHMEMVKKRSSTRRFLRRSG
ncbi:C1QL [Mytilus edulis]|uniref:C1QL n=1 Tax=Mytilus edulis TaxID=6550 RepID=A0A8S3RH39_MYTED|nr:C1QL [Mytilus edulis]